MEGLMISEIESAESFISRFRIRLREEINQGKIHTGIYQITSPKGRIYIGQSRNIQKRFLCYLSLGCYKQRRLYNSFLKHGVDRHQFKVIVQLSPRSHKDKINIHEKLAIEWFKKQGCEMLNLTNGGEGHTILPETRAKMSASKVGRYAGENNPNYGKGCFGERNGMYGKKHTKESIEKGHITRLERYKDKWELSKILTEEKRIESYNNWKRKVSKKGKKITPREVVQVDEYGNFINRFPTLRSAGIENNIHPAHVYKSCVKGKFAPTTRFKFIYAEIYDNTHTTV